MAFPRFVVCRCYKKYNRTPEATFDNINDALKYSNEQNAKLFGSVDVYYIIWDIIEKKEVR